jgi:hypothetical protein
MPHFTFTHAELDGKLLPALVLLVGLLVFVAIWFAVWEAWWWKRTRRNEQRAELAIFERLYLDALDAGDMEQCDRVEVTAACRGLEISPAVSERRRKKLGKVFRVVVGAKDGETHLSEAPVRFEVRPLVPPEQLPPLKRKAEFGLCTFPLCPDPPLAGYLRCKHHETGASKKELGLCETPGCVNPRLVLFCAEHTPNHRHDADEEPQS